LSTVYDTAVAQHIKLGNKVAIKIVSKSMLKEKNYDVKIQREIFNTKQLHHPHIVRLYEYPFPSLPTLFRYEVVETERSIFIVLEYVEGGELFDYIVNHGRVI
jgi:serine/threonine protein kinase